MAEEIDIVRYKLIDMKYRILRRAVGMWDFDLSHIHRVMQEIECKTLSELKSIHRHYMTQWQKR